MLIVFLPNKHVKSVFDIDPVQLKEKGIQGIITDLDNTLVPWDVRDASPDIVKWFEEIAGHDIKIMIISNNNKERVSIFSKPLEVPYVYSARKPLRGGFNRAAKQLELKNEQIAVIGDQVLTDVLGGNLGGFYTILVVPIVETDAKITRFNRAIERRILNYFRKKGKLEEWNKNG